MSFIDTSKFNDVMDVVNNIKANERLTVDSKGVVKTAKVASLIEKFREAISGKRSERTVGIVLMQYADYALRNDKLQEADKLVGIAQKLLSGKGSLKKDKQEIKELAKNIHEYVSGRAYARPDYFHEKIEQFSTNYGVKKEKEVGFETKQVNNPDTQNKNEVGFETKQVSNQDMQEYQHSIYINYGKQSEPFKVGFNKGDKVSDLKTRIANKTNFVVNQQTLILNGKELDDSSVIEGELYSKLLQVPNMFLVDKGRREGS